MAAKKTTTGTNDVVAWFAKREDHPQTETMLAVRDVLLSDGRLEECIKWQTPTFAYLGNLASFQPNAKKFASLMFHRGGEIPGTHPELLGDSPLARTMRFESLEDVKAKKAALLDVVQAWCSLKDESAK